MTKNANSQPKESDTKAITDTERILATIWSEVLECDNISSLDDFLVLGGDSVDATHISWRIVQSFRVEVPMAACFEHPTIRELAGYIDKMREATT